MEMVNFLEGEMNKALHQISEYEEITRTEANSGMITWWRGYATAIDNVLTKVRQDNLQSYEEAMLYEMG